MTIRAISCCLALSLLHMDLSAQAPLKGKPDPELARLIQKDIGPHPPEGRYGVATFPINGQSDTGVVIYTISRENCGSGGCGMRVYERHESGYLLIGQTTITRPPIRMLPTTANGHSDLSVLVSGGGIIRAYNARLRFNGRRYPSNPSVPPAQPLPRNTPGTVLLDYDDVNRDLRKPVR